MYMELLYRRAWPLTSSQCGSSCFKCHAGLGLSQAGTTVSSVAFASHLALLGFAFCPCSGVGGVELWWWRIGDAMADADGDFGRKHPDSMARSCCAACCTVWAFATAPAAARGCGRARRVGSWQATFCGVLAVLLALDVGAGVLHLLRLPRGHGLFVCASCHSYDFW